MSIRRTASIFLMQLSVRAFSLGLSALERVPRQHAKPIPITVLSGFLGSGKTSLLQHLLNNNQGLRIAVIVNDVASVNIDSKLVSSSTTASRKPQDGDPEQQPVGAAGIVQLENGCACCSLSEELLGSVSELVLLNDIRGEALGFDHIVVELSGVADPKGVRAKFQEAVLYDMPLMERVRLDTMATLVDCSTFLSHLRNSKLANPRDSPELFYRPGEAPPPEAPDWTDDLPAPLLEALLAGERVYGSADEGQGGVVDLLVSQCEIADVCLLNKVDLCGDEELREVESIVKALNPRATVLYSEFGDVPIEKVLAVAGGTGVVEAGVVDDHKTAVMSALGTHTGEPSSSDRNTQSLHRASHDPTCSDPTHEHDHAHDHSPSHSHSHDHGHECHDPGCTDPSHSHDHSQYFGLGSFVYRARRPFHPRRLVSFLQQMPISRGLPTLTDPSVEEESDDAFRIPPDARDALRRVLRSKGFAWSAHSDAAALYWSHAGTSFEMSCLGRWWATLARENWPAEAAPAILEDFVSPNAIETDPSLDFVGDRRQELVFIGTGLGGSEAQEAISSALNRCLLDDEEWARYRALRDDSHSLESAFPNLIESKVLTY